MERARRVRLPEISVPTYASWNLRDASIGAPDQRVSFEDSQILLFQDGCGTTKEWGPKTVDTRTLR